MKSKIRITIIILLFYSFAFSQTGKISVQVTGFKNDRGLVHIVLFNQSKGFPTEYGHGLIFRSLPIDTSSISIIFDSLSYGEYALSVLHDENENEKMDTNFFGFPQEGYGVSNNVNPVISYPRFDDALFSFKQPQKTIKIILNYK